TQSIHDGKKAPRTFTDGTRSQPPSTRTVASTLPRRRTSPVAADGDNVLVRGIARTILSPLSSITEGAHSLWHAVAVGTAIVSSVISELDQHPILTAGPGQVNRPKIN